MTVRSSSLSSVLLVASLAVPQAGQEAFDLVATASPAGAAKGAITVPMILRIDRYTPAHALVTMSNALKARGYPGFLLALRDAPPAGTLEVAGQMFLIRWARQVSAGAGRTISIVTDSPVFFVGRGRSGAKPTGGYEVAVLQLTLDAAGRGEGTMAAAARVKSGGDTGVRIDNYADAPLTLTAAARAPVPK